MNPLTEVRGEMSVQQLAEKAGVSISAIALIESGATKRPHEGTVKRLADALGVDHRALDRDLYDWHYNRKAAA